MIQKQKTTHLTSQLKGYFLGDILFEVLFLYSPLTIDTDLYSLDL